MKYANFPQMYLEELTSVLFGEGMKHSGFLGAPEGTALAKWSHSIYVTENLRNSKTKR